MPISRTKARFLSEYSFRAEASKVLKRIIEQNRDRDYVVAMPPSGVMDSYWRLLKKLDCTIIAIRDNPANILDRITLFDDDSQPIHKVLTQKEKAYYLKDIKKDITYFGKSYQRAHYTMDIAGIGIEGSVEKIINCFREKSEILMESPPR